MRGGALHSRAWTRVWLDKGWACYPSSRKHPKFAQLCLRHSRYARVGNVGRTVSRSSISVPCMRAFSSWALRHIQRWGPCICLCDYWLEPRPTYFWAHGPSLSGLSCTIYLSLLYSPLTHRFIISGRAIDSVICSTDFLPNLCVTVVCDCYCKL